MKFCKKCQINANKQLDNCPLCGSFLNSSNDNTNCEIYQKIEGVSSRPTVTLEKQGNFLQTKFYKLLLVSLAVCVVVNLMLAPETLWSAYVVVGGFFVMMCIILPIADRLKLQIQVKIDLLVVTLCAIALEFLIGGFSFGWFVVTNVLPWIYAGTIILMDFLIVFRRYEDRKLFSTLFLATLFAIMPFVALLIGRGFKAVSDIPLTISIVTIAALLNLATVLVVCTNSMKEEFERNYSI